MLVKVPKESVEEFLDKLRERVYGYNTKIKDYGVYLKPYHIVYKKEKKYIYIGKYWYKIMKVNGKLKWIYLGRSKPIGEMPDPPSLVNFTIVMEGNTYILDERMLNQIVRHELLY
jgi:hypothetical protein